MRQTMQTIRSWIPLLTLATLAGCTSREAPSPVKTATPFNPVATIQDIMDAEVDPSADALWDAVAFVSSAAGVEDRHPRTDEDWKAARRSAITLVESANLLAMEGRRVAVGNAVASEGEPDARQIQLHLDATLGSFQQFARALQVASQTALTAIDKHDVKGLMDAGGGIDTACESCHVVYWYPNEASAATQRAAGTAAVSKPSDR